MRNDPSNDFVELNNIVLFSPMTVAFNFQDLLFMRRRSTNTTRSNAGIQNVSSFVDVIHDEEKNHILYKDQLVCCYLLSCIV